MAKSEFIEVELEGLDLALQGLNKLKDKVARYGLKRGLRAGVDVVATEVRQRTPVKTGLLREFVQTTVRTKDRNSGYATVNFGSEGFIARLVELGHRRHGRVGTKGKLAKRGSVAEANSDIAHVPPHPFMRPAFDASKDRATEAFVEAVAEVIFASLTVEGATEE